MKSCRIFALLTGLLLFVQTSFALSLDITVGNRAIIIPSPGESFIEMPTLMKEATKANLPPQNRFLCGFLDSNDLSQQTAASVQSMPQIEQQNFDASMFQMVTAQTKAAMGGHALEEVLANYDEANKQFELGTPRILGTLFETPNYYGYAMEISVSDGAGNIAHLLIGSCLINVKEKIILTSMTYPYEEGRAEGILKPKMEEWSEAILAANK